MHAISFLLKRAHLRTTAVGQEMLYKVPGMTPARFDILCFARQWMIRWQVESRAITSQERIRHAMGLHASTISRMLGRLERLGWIERERDCEDRRYKIVELTALGLRKTWEAMRAIFRGRELAAHFEMLARNLRPTQHVLEALDHLYETLDLVALGFGDTAAFHYSYGSRTHKPFWARQRVQRKRKVIYRRDPKRGPRIVDPPPVHPTPYEIWVAPLLRPVPKAELEGPPRPRRPWVELRSDKTSNGDGGDGDDGDDGDDDVIEFLRPGVVTPLGQGWRTPPTS